MYKIYTMVDQYWRKIEDVENDIENTMQISSILLKHKVYDKKLEGLSKIDTNEGNISSNLEKINDNENSISNNLDKINNFSQYILKSAKDFERTFNIEKQIFRFNKDKHFYTIFEKEIEHDFIKNSLLFVKNNIHYKYDNLSNDYHRTQHEYNIYDDKDNLIHKYLFNKDIYYDKNSDPILNTTEDFCICFKENCEKIKIVLELHRHNRHGFGDINLEIDDDNENYIKIDYIDKHNEENKNDILSNTGRISTNEENISSNLSKLNNIENNLILVDDIYNETFPISRFSVTSKDNRIFYRQLYSNFTTNGIIKINAKYNYVHDENYTLQHVYRFYNNKRQFKKIELQHDRSSKVINDKFEIQGIDSNRIDIAIYYENNTDSKKIELVGNNAIQINYIENNSKLDMNKNNISDNLGKIDTNTSSISDNSGLISTNTGSIASNLLKINKNTDNITALQTSNVKAFYNLDQIFIYDIEKGNQTVNKDNHFHIFEKEIIYNFTKNS